MRIKSSVKTVTLLPITIVLVLTLYFLYSEYTNFSNIQKVTKDIQTIDILNRLEENISKERKLAIELLLSNSNENEFELNKQIKKTNESVNEIVKLYNENKNDKLVFKIIKDIKQIVSIRYKLKNKKIKYNKLFSSYDTLNSDIILKTNSINDSISPKINKKINSYKTSINLSKSISDERDFIAKIFIKNADIDNIYLIKFFKDANIYKSFLQVDKKLENTLKPYLNNKNFLNILKKSNEIKKNILQKGYSNNFKLKTWYKIEDKKLNLLFQTNKNLSEKIKNDISLEGEISIGKITIFLVILLLSLYMLYKYNKLKKYFYEHKYIKLLLQKSVDTNLTDKKIDLDTVEGIEKAYKLIDVSLDKIEIERQKAQNENASKTIFLANMSHEIRTPINGIVGFTDLLKKSNLNKEQREYIEIISKSTDNLLDIINNILDLSKIESKKIEVDSITFSPIEEFENAVELFIAKAAKKNINLSLFLDPTFENYLIGDPLKVKEVLLNLISNSIKFTPENGEINVRIKKIEEKQYGKEKIYFEVTDNGIGMTEEELSEVFDAFTQADSTITRKYGGTGLGLTISSNYVSLLGGELEVYSKKNKGTSFFFTLEFKKSQPLKISKYKNSFSYIKPLIITDDDNLELAKFLQKYLNFFTNDTTYIEVDTVKDNITKFDRANLIIITKNIYEKYDFTYIDKTNKKLLIIEPTKEYQNKVPSTNKNSYKLIEPIGFFKTIEVLTAISPSEKLSLLSYMDKSEKDSKENYKILIAEDNNINLKLIEKIFNQYKNITLEKASNGQDAIDRFINDKFDIILMDIAMPVLDGVSATKKIIEYENINSLTHTPIIALTANALKGDKEKFLSAGMDEYLTKPVVEELLLDKLNRFGINPTKEIATKKTKDNTIQEEQKLIQNNNLPLKDILIYKKSTVETKIFQKVLSSLYKKIDIAQTTDEFLKKLEQYNYKAILLDKELQDLDTSKLIELKNSYKHSAFILFRNFETRISNKLRAVFDETIINSADKGYLQTILDNYIKIEE